MFLNVIYAVSNGESGKTKSVNYAPDEQTKTLVALALDPNQLGEDPEGQPSHRRLRSSLYEYSTIQRAILRVTARVSEGLRAGRAPSGFADALWLSFL